MKTTRASVLKELILDCQRNIITKQIAADYFDTRKDDASKKASMTAKAEIDGFKEKELVFKSFLAMEK